METGSENSKQKPTLQITNENPGQDQEPEEKTTQNDETKETTQSGKPKKKRAGRRKIKIEFIQDKSRRHITFSKRKGGIMKKAYELSTLTGTQVLLLVASETGHVYTFATPKLQPLITKTEGKNLIQSCLNAPDHPEEQEEYENESEDKRFGKQIKTEMKQTPYTGQMQTTPMTQTPQQLSSMGMDYQRGYQMPSLIGQNSPIQGRGSVQGFSQSLSSNTPQSFLGANINPPPPFSRNYQPQSPGQFSTQGMQNFSLQGNKNMSPLSGMNLQSQQLPSNLQTMMQNQYSMMQSPSTQTPPQHETNKNNW